MTGDHTRATRYLLGTLSESEADALSAEMFASDDAFNALEDAENALIEEYLDGRLSPDDRARFEALVQSSADLAERVELERALRARLGHARPAARGRSAVWLPWAAAILLGLTGGGLALRENRQAARDRADGSAREHALSVRLAEQDERLRGLEERLAGQAAPSFETWRLAEGRERTAGAAAPFVPTTGWVRLRVASDGASAGASYRAQLTTPEGREIYRGAGQTAASEPGGPFVDFIVSGGLLPRGTYVLSVTRVGPAGPQELGPYSFSVRPR